MARSKESRTTSKTNSHHEPASAPALSSEATPSKVADQHYLISSGERTLTASGVPYAHEGNGSGTITVTSDTRNNSTLLKSHLSQELVEKIKELVRLSHEQGYLTYGDINEALPDTM